MDHGEPQWQPISNPPFLAAYISHGVTLAREHLALLGEARGAYKLSNADVDAIIRAWTQTRTDLSELYTEQGRRWQDPDLRVTRPHVRRPGSGISAPPAPICSGHSTS